MKLNILRFVPNQINNKLLQISHQDNFLGVSMQGTGSPKSIIIRKEIDVNNFFMEIVGLYFGDGLNTRKGTGSRRTAFANSNHHLQIYWINFLECIGLKKKDLFAQVSVGKNHQHRNNEALEYWLTKTKLPRAIFSRVSNCKEKSLPQGVLSLEFNSIIFRKIFDNLFDYSIKLLEQNKQLIYPFIRGLIAAEGRVALRKDSGTLNYLGIAVKDKDKRDFIRGLLRSINIKSSEDTKETEIIMHGYLNFKIAKEFNLLDLHLDKKKKFHQSYLKLIKTNVHALTKLKIIELLKENPITRFKIAEELNQDISNIHKALRDLEIKKIIRRCGKNRQMDIWCLVEVPKDLSILMKRDYPKWIPKNL